nr:SpoVG family protein [uncultured Oscillibacter sp.]
MDIDVRINSIRTNGPVLATASFNLNGAFAVRGVKILDGSNGPFVSMPSYKTSDGYKDICFPCNREFKLALDNAILGAYQQQIGQVAQRGHTDHSQEPPTPEMTM